MFKNSIKGLDELFRSDSDIPMGSEKIFDFPEQRRCRSILGIDSSLRESSFPKANITDLFLSLISAF